MTVEPIDLRRVGTALFVVLLHALLILTILNATVHKTANVSSAREMILRFFRPTAPAKSETAPPPAVMIVPSARPSNAITTPAETPNGALEGLHQFLFNCAPENLGNLTAEQRAQCGSQALAPIPDETNTLLNQPSRALDPRHWARALARKKTPPLLPCANPQAAVVSLETVICLGKAAVQGGFGDLDEAPGYGDTPPIEIHVPNNGDPQLDSAHH